MRITIALFVVLALLISGCVSQTSVHGSGPVKIGVILQETKYTGNIRDGIQSAFSSLNQTNVQIIYEYANSAEEAEQKLAQLIKIYNISAVITHGEKVAPKISELSITADIVHIDVGTIAPFSGAFRFGIAPLQMADAEAVLITAKGIDNAGVVYTNTSYGTAMRNYFARRMSRYGNTPVEVVFEPGRSDFSAYAQIMDATGAVAVITGPGEAVKVIEDLKKSYGGLIFTDNVSLGSAAPDGVFFVSMENNLAAEAGDALKAVALASSECSNAQCIKRAFASLDFIGMSGRVRFNSDMEITTRKVSLFRVVNGTVFETGV